MTVFISYRHTDREKAITINNKLRNSGISTYLDVLDSESQTTDDITGVITVNISRCSHLIAVISPSTSQSWWVPFEIGEATISGRRIASFNSGYGSLPEYLKKWPQMTNDDHINLFIKAYLEEGSSIRSGVLNEGYSKQTNRTYANDFHSNLKNKILRGY